MEAVEAVVEEDLPVPLKEPPSLLGGRWWLLEAEEGAGRVPLLIGFLV